MAFQSQMTQIDLHIQKLFWDGGLEGDRMSMVLRQLPLLFPRISLDLGLTSRFVVVSQG
jgi:hypothetical protein